MVFFFPKLSLLNQWFIDNVFSGISVYIIKIGCDFQESLVHATNAARRVTFPKIAPLAGEVASGAPLAGEVASGLDSYEE